MQTPANKNKSARRSVASKTISKIHEVKRFAVAGAANTSLCALVIYGLQAATGHPFLANAMGYAIAGVWAYLLHARYTFKTKANKRGLALFALVSGSGYALNALVLGLTLQSLSPVYAQAAAVASYAIYSYAMQSRLVFSAQHRRD